MRETGHLGAGKKITAESTSKTIAGYGDRSAIILTNYGEKRVTIAFGPTAVFEEGPALNEKGGSLLLEGYSGPISIITKESTSVVGYSEF